MMIPEAWENHESMPADKRAFYQFHASLMEPWDGPASIAFTDGTVIGAVLDRNGLRPSRYWVTADGLVVMASEVGVLDIDPAEVVQKGRLQPGRMFLVDTSQGRIIGDDELKADAGGRASVRRVARTPGSCTSTTCRRAASSRRSTARSCSSSGCSATRPRRSRSSSTPMAKTGYEPIGSMGTDTPIAVLSDRPRLLFDYFQQLFAQVTNPPLDAIREELVTSLGSHDRTGRQPARPDARVVPADRAAAPDHRRTPTWRSSSTSTRTATCPASGRSRSTVCIPVAEGGDGLRRALDEVRAKVSDAIADGAKLIILSDRHSNEELAPIPSLLLVVAVHHHLIREKTRTKVGLVIESGDAREVHHMALLLGYGAAAVNPYLAFETIDDLIAPGLHCTGLSKAPGHAQLHQGVRQGRAEGDVEDGHLDGRVVHGRAGLRGHRARAGRRRRVLHRHHVASSAASASTCSRPRSAARHRFAYLDRPEERGAPRPVARRRVPVAARGRVPPLQPARPCSSCSTRRAPSATRSSRSTRRLVDEQSRTLATLRGLFRFRDGVRKPVPIDEVEPVSRDRQAVLDGRDVATARSRRRRTRRSRSR